jgi:hypothetical protein
MRGNAEDENAIGKLIIAKQQKSSFLESRKRSQGWENWN